MAITRQELADRLDDLASMLKSAPINVIGMNISMQVSGNTSGNIVGYQSTMSIPQGASGTFIGTKIDMSGAGQIVSEKKIEKEQLISELLDAVAKIKAGSGVSDTWLKKITDRLIAFGNDTISAAAVAARQAYLGF